MSSILSQRVLKLAPSATLAASDKAKALRQQGIDIINLSAGEPDFPTPDFIKTAAINAINNDKTGYTPVDGVPALKDAIIHKLQRDNQLKYEPNQIIVSSGVKQVLFNLAQALLNPGDEVICIAPYWVSYPSIAQLAGATTQVIETSIDQAFKVTPEQLDAAITPKTKLLFLNSPSNPTGAVYTHAELAALGEVLLQHPQVLIVSDDIYEYITWGDAAFYNILNACPELYERTIVINGAAKSYCMTGWRIGYAACQPQIMTAMKKIQSQSTTCANSIAQHAAIAAFSAQKSDFVQPMLDAYQERSQWLVQAINHIEGLHAIPTHSTFYLFVAATELIARLGLADDMALANFLLDKAHVATVPGSAFGSPNYLRLSYATSLEQIQTALNRIQQAVAA